jgi:hypothetical protein
MKHGNAEVVTKERNGLLAMPKSLSLITVVGLLALDSFAAAPAPITPTRHEGALVLFDTARHGPEVFRNYTASWKEGSNLVPVTVQATRNAERFVQFSYEKDKGTAISLIRFENLPRPPEGTQYSGIRLVIDYDKQDYTHISIASRFSDNTQVTSPLVLERGTNEYEISGGFRRAKFPPDWNRLSWIWLSVDAGQDSHDKNVVYRLKKITMIEEKVEKPILKTVAFGDRIFCPEPKQINWKTGKLPAREQTHIYLPATASARTKRTAEVFRLDYARHTGTTLAGQTFDRELPDEGIAMRIAGSILLNGSPAQLKPEGYHLQVEPTRVVITGADEPGLYYATVTFFQLMRNSMRIEDSMPIPCVEILDWPDMANRLCRLEHPHHFKNNKLKENRGIDFLVEWTDRFVAGNKLNVFFLDISAVTFYRRRPEFNGTERLYSLDDLRRFGQFCRDRFIDLCPAWQIGGHANWWLTYGYHPELVERGWSHAQGDTTHPDHDKIVYDCMLDVIETLQPKYASPKSDEWWTQRDTDSPLPELLRGKTRAEAFLDHHIKLNEWLNARGITMMMYHDMITPYHNGKRFDLYTITDQMPNNIVILHWSTPKDVTKWFAPKGLTTWMNPTGMQLIPEGLEAYIDGYGKGLYSFGDSKMMPSELKDTSNMYTLHRAADHAWNLSSDRRIGWEELVESGRLVAIRNLFAVRPNPNASQTIRPLDIHAQMNQAFNDFLKHAKGKVYANQPKPVTMPGGINEIGFVPTLFAPDDADNCVVVGKGDPEVTLPIGGRFSSLIFLHTAHLRTCDGIKPTTYRRWPYGFPCGDYVVHYEDGSNTILPLRFEYNIRRFDVPSVNRATNDNRYVHTLKAADNTDVHLFQWEWVNPWPNKRIICVDVRHDNELDVALAVFAISGRTAAERR